MPPLDFSPFDVSVARIAEQWDQLLGAFPAATSFHGSAWGRVLHESYGYRPRYLVTRASPSHSSGRAGREQLPSDCDPNEAPLGLLPLMEVDSWATGRRGIVLPFTDECEPLARSADVVENLYDAALAEGRERGWKYLELRGGPRPKWATAPSTSFYGHVLELACPESALFARIDSAARRAIRKAEQSSVVVEVSQSLESLQHLYELLRLTRRRHGVPPQPFSFFRSLHRLVLSPLGGNPPRDKRSFGHVFLAHHGSRVVAGALFLQLGTNVLFKFGASDHRYQHLRANNLVMWQAIKHYAGQGVSRLDFGRTSVGNDGLRRFKLSWGTQERTLDYYRYDFRTDAPVQAPDRSSGRHTLFFRRLPLPLSSLVGALLYRHIA